MTSVRRGLNVLAAALLTATAGLCVAPPAQARSKVPAECPADSLCLWQNVRFGGDFVATSAEQTPRWASLPGGKNCQTKTWNDCVSSVWNRTTKAYRLYEHYNYQGRSIDICPDFSGNVPLNLNDVLSSSRVIAPADSSC